MNSDPPALKRYTPPPPIFEGAVGTTFPIFCLSGFKYDDQNTFIKIQGASWVFATGDKIMSPHSGKYSKLPLTIVDLNSVFLFCQLK